MTVNASDQSPRYLSTIFSDDIRQEIGGKISIMGIYKSKMLVERFPVEVHKLAVVMSAVTSINNPFSKLNFKILKNGEILQEFSVPTDNLSELRSQFSEDRESPFFELQFLAMLKPLNLDGNTLISTLIETETGTIYGQNIEICTAV